MIKVTITDDTDLAELDTTLRHMGLYRVWSVVQQDFVLRRVIR